MQPIVQGEGIEGESREKVMSKAEELTPEE